MQSLQWRAGERPIDSHPSFGRAGHIPYPMSFPLTMKLVVAITGSSGAIYALDFLKKCPADKFLVVSSWGKVLLRDEL